MPTTVETTPTNTTRVTGRRQVRYESYDDLIADAERLATCEVRALGNWTYGQILDHLAKSIHAMIDGPGFSLPMPVRAVMRLVMMKKMVHREIPPGFKFPKHVAPRFEPANVEVAPAIDALRSAVERVKSTRHRGLHPAFGKIDPADWDAFQWRHCEMHMSFVVPV